MYSAKATTNLTCTRVSSAHTTATSVLGSAAIPTVRSARARRSDKSTGFVEGPGGGTAGSLGETE
eukprot:6638308-Pyramimonas_sp.AAC.1